MRLFRFLRICWSLAGSGGTWEEDCEWGDQDAMSLRLFLSGEAGQRFKLMLKNSSIRGNARAVLSSDPAGEGRRAAGFMECVETISALATPLSRETNEEEEGASSFLEQIAP